VSIFNVSYQIVVQDIHVVSVQETICRESEILRHNSSWKQRNALKARYSSSESCWCKICMLSFALSAGDAEELISQPQHTHAIRNQSMRCFFPGVCFLIFAPFNKYYLTASHKLHFSPGKNGIHQLLRCLHYAAVDFTRAFP